MAYVFFWMKCCFWLALVYAALLYGVGPFGSSAVRRADGTVPARHTLRQDVTAAHGVVEAAASSVAGLCANHAADCLAEAARLTALFKASAVDAGSPDDTRPVGRAAIMDETETASVDVGTLRETPMPVPDPRRRVRALKLTPKS